MIRNKEILITGGCGFIGSHLAELLVKAGNKVTCFDRYNIENNWGWLEDSECREEIKVTLGDIRDYDSVFNVMEGKDMVFHLAALIGIPYSYISPLAYIRTNVEGTYNVLESARKLLTEDLLITSTSETYGSAQYTPIDEKHPLVGQSPYSASKIAADQLAISYFKSFGSNIKIVRPFNTYGPRQSMRAVIPTIIAQILSDNKKISLGSLTPTRDLTFVEDTCRGFIAISQNDSFKGEVINIGMNTEISIGDLAKLISDISGKDIEIVSEKIRIRPDHSEVVRLVCDNSKLMSNSDWKPKFKIKEGLEKTFLWFQKTGNTRFYKPDRYNV